MVKTRFVQCGRLALVNYGPWEGKTCVIRDVIDHRRCLVGNPETNMPWHQTPIRRLNLTAQVNDALKPNSPRKKWDAATKALLEEFNESAWAKKLVIKEKRKNLTDFDRFKLKWARQHMNTEARKIAAGKSKKK
eukprot:NODE_23785_length_651_cov_4.061069.p3 GENE.NODE_23785_length_651_cov_4.061069~~NODE_23785_length_651_cov_4.061069.p3  ORF type:complete len:134 (-),score=39.84 NODE_23785_length_651_cov_4.061069:184-585(-)